MKKNRDDHKALLTHNDNSCEKTHKCNWKIKENDRNNVCWFNLVILYWDKSRMVGFDHLLKGKLGTCM